jgi:transposase-like protein
MPMSPEIREQIVQELFRGESVKKIAERFNKPIGHIQTIRNQFLKDDLESSVESLSKQDASVVKALAHTLNEQELPHASQVVDNVAKGIEALQVLQPKITKGLDTIVDKLNERLEAEDFSLKEIPMISKTLIEINNALYNRPQTQVNITSQTLIQEKANEKIKQLTKGILNDL